jgi:hypothetical protein
MEVLLKLDGFSDAAFWHVLLVLARPSATKQVLWAEPCTGCLRAQASV